MNTQLMPVPFYEYIEAGNIYTAHASLVYRKSTPVAANLVYYKTFLRGRSSAVRAAGS